jgi:hypothetical protein
MGYYQYDQLIAKVGEYRQGSYNTNTAPASTWMRFPQ